ncbi:helix-turn-helix domain-containing protein [Petrimonas sp.]|uniref:helix-turn-helix domain-containing protein n=1 Tax=Petrimonas sp. TaxID=2023866 RepID=UPI003F515B6F
MLIIDRERNTSKRFLTFFLSFISINFFIHAVYFNHHYELYAILDSVWVFTSLLSFPLYYYYIRLLTTDTTIKYKWSWLTLPSFFLATYCAVIYILMTPEEVASFVQGILYLKSGYEPYSQLIQLQILREQLFKILFTTQIILSVYFGLKLINNYNHNVRSFYSNTGGKDLTSTKWVFVAFIMASVVSAIASNIGKSYFITHSWLLFLPSVTYSACIFFSGYVGYMQRFTIEHFTRNVNEYESRKKTRGENVVAHYYIPDLDNLKSLQDRLIYLLEKKEIFKNPELKISDVSLLLKTNRTYVSKIINEEMNTNFCDLVNSYRINYAEGLLRSQLLTDSLSITKIAEISGFSSLSSFYRIFKSKNGVSPRTFKQVSNITDTSRELAIDLLNT